VSHAFQFYATTLLVYLGVDVLSVWSLNLQYGMTGIYNFAWILFQSIGAYTAAVLTLGPSTANTGFQHFILGTSIPFPLPLLIAGAVAGVFSIPIGFVALRRLRADYEATVMLVISVVATLIVSNVQGMFNGTAGLSLIPEPLYTFLHVSTLSYSWLYVLFTAVVCGIVYIFVHRVTSSPLGRAMRAVRDNEAAAESLGKHVTSVRMFAFIFGNVIAGMSGALLVQFIGAWSPGAWFFVETLIILTAIIVGGTGNNGGVILGALLVPIVFNEATRYIPTSFAPAAIVDSVQWCVIGGLALAFLWFRPQGILPERRRRFPVPPEYAAMAAAGRYPPHDERGATGTPPVAVLASETES